MADRSGYIGRAPGDSSVTVARQTFSPTGITTDFTFESGYTPGYFDIFINGAKMIEGSDYTSTDGSTFVILNGGAISGDVIEGVAYKAFNAATATIGISSAGTPISTQANVLNFVGTGNTFALRGTTIDVSISGGGAGAGGTWSNYDSNAGVTTTKKVKIQNNLEVTGVTTSTGGFVGNVTGNATGITGTPDITVRNITGVAATFTGVLTYEDVTNIDSVGLVTARSGINVVGGGLTVTGVSTFFSTANFNGFNEFNGDVQFDGNVDFFDSVEFKGTSGASSVHMYDENAIHFGDQNDGKIIYNNTGNIIKFERSGSAGEIEINARPVTLQFSSSTKLQTAGTGVTVTGRVDATSFAGDGSALTNLPAAGLTTEALVSSGIVTTLNLTAAQDHKVTASGITTITVSGGTEADSHTVRIINSGITTIGFSTFFLFPSGSAPSLPTADGAISLISFTVNRVGTAGTQLLAGASLNFS